MQYAHALRSIGCDVYWLERFNPSDQKQRDDFKLGIFRERMRQFGMEDRAILYTRDTSGRRRYLDAEGAATEALFRRADLLLNFHYAIDPELLDLFPRTALVDIDPGLLQHWMHAGELEVPSHDVYFTTGETVGAQDAAFPDCGLSWSYIRPAISLDLWPYVEIPEVARFTTISSWIGGVDGEWVTDGRGSFYDNNKRTSFLEFLELPTRTDQPLELALCLDESEAAQQVAREARYTDYRGDVEDRRRLEANGWQVRHAHEVSSSPEAYQTYVQRSRGEFSCAKPSCMRFRNAWISDRTLCYLASGRPAVVQDTGPSFYLPHDMGLFRFSTLDDAVAAFEVIDRDYEKQRHAAREIVETWFDAQKIVPRILEQALS
jgi:hypothetical protein